ncbi:glycosyltransferase family 29 protein [Schumannella sp. 10F1B-5-1]|uniref:glycosyltransferase family 29 protein n=1 Tax=Schumannella sp. 10F1B-5-1 TaxID=2590780 RepID=UPI0011312488|nr:glycosyltransferase family 29 protein [Schumannella sp. 10F1B-5-1]TPW73543.1 hypothetical protein FJ658_04985 [Schumannella sp. 10F1B-5-1]
MSSRVVPPRRRTFDVIRDLCLVHASSSPVRTIAIVGNAPQEPSAERAHQIDSADLVFRVNGFRLDRADEAPTVGRRADVVMFNRGLRATPWFFEGYRSRLYLMVEPGRMHWESEVVPAWWPPDLGFITMPNDELTLPISEEIGVDARIDPSWPTTGTMLIWTAHQLFPAAQLRVSGFSFLDDPHQTSWEHSYGAPSPVGPEHRIDAEGDLVHRILAAGSAVRV